MDDVGKPHDISSTDVNKYLQDATGTEITAKDFRTWAGTLLAAHELKRIAEQAHKPTKRSVDHVVATVAERLGNTKSVCRKCYIHPAVLESFLSGTLLDVYRASTSKTSRAALRVDEAALLRLLKKQTQKWAGHKSRAA
jgi:DNA topoisomerase-1